MKEIFPFIAWIEILVYIDAICSKIIVPMRKPGLRGESHRMSFDANEFDSHSLIISYSFVFKNPTREKEKLCNIPDQFMYVDRGSAEFRPIIV